MKISKVNHTRIGMGKNPTANPGGFLYFDPPRKPSEKFVSDIEKYINDKLNKNAKRLYSVFTNTDKIINDVFNNNNNNNKEQRFACSSLIGNFNHIIKEWINTEDFLYDLPSKELKLSYKTVKIAELAKKENKLSEKDKEKLIEEMMLYCVRKSLSGKSGDIELKKVIEKLLRAYLNIDKYNEYMAEIEESELKELREKIYSDYNKKEFSKKTAKSICNQDVKVSISNDNKIGLKNTENRKYIFEFVKKYAIGTYKERVDMIGEIMKIISLYYTGKKENLIYKGSGSFIEEYKELNDKINCNAFVFRYAIKCNQSSGKFKFDKSVGS